ncbi:hypothetical protein AOA60_15250 [Pseudomonas sp. 2822-17]|nr:hypothetical protein AOA60_15250 [Pseudomonas sp. 2822-17]
MARTAAQFAPGTRPGTSPGASVEHLARRYFNRLILFFPKHKRQFILFLIESQYFIGLAGCCSEHY